MRIISGLYVPVVLTICRVWGCVPRDAGGLPRCGSAFAEACQRGTWGASAEVAFAARPGVSGCRFFSQHARRKRAVPCNEHAALGDAWTHAKPVCCQCQRARLQRPRGLGDPAPRFGCRGRTTTKQNRRGIPMKPSSAVPPPRYSATAPFVDPPRHQHSPNTPPT